MQNVVASRDYYRDTLGFGVTAEFGAPLTYVCLFRNDIRIHLQNADAFDRRAGQGSVTVFVTEVDSLHDGLAANGAHILKPPRSYSHGIRNFGVLDPDGNQLTFGMPVS